MGRIRTIKPEILEDVKTRRLSDKAWRLFVSSWVVADDDGVFRADPDVIEGMMCVASPLRALGELSESGLVVVYSVREQIYGRITGWKKHQKIDKPSTWRFPSQEEAETTGFDRVLSEYSPSTQPQLAEPSLLARARDDLDHDHDHDLEGSERAHARTRAIKPKDPFGQSFYSDPPMAPPQDDDVVRSLASNAGVTLESAWAKCRDHFLGKGIRSPDWSATFRNWLRREPAFAKTAPTKPKKTGLALIESMSEKLT